MLRRVIDDWLSKTTERAFQAPFCQMLAARGETVVHSSRHCAMELGKDVISIAPGGRVHAYQLKTGSRGRLTLSEWRNGLQQQAFDLVATGVRHPSLHQRRHHRSFFVINGALDEEVSEDIARMNVAWANQRMRDYQLETIVLGELARMATDLEEAFWPTELPDVNTLLKLYLDDGTGQLPKEKVAQLLEAVMMPSSAGAGCRGKAECLRLLGSGGVLCALALSRFTKGENRLAEIEGWTVYLASVFGVAQRHRLSERMWRPSVDLATMFISSLLERLVEEVQNSPTLVVGNPFADRAVRQIRIMHLVALFCVLWLYRRLGNVPLNDLDEVIRGFCVAHASQVALWCEAAAPQVLAAYWGLRSMAPHVRTDDLLLHQVDRITALNGRDGPGALYSPYYGAEDVCERLLGLSQDADDGESFRHRSHALESFIYLAVRENLRTTMGLRWRAISHVMFAEFDTVATWHNFRWRNRNEGKLVLRMPRERQSWSELRTRFNNDRSTRVPNVLRKCPVQTLLFLLAYPHRLKPAWASWLDRELRA